MNAPHPRLCHIRKWPNFNGYGFNLHTEKNKEGQLVGRVDPGSPAEAAGLKEGDRIIEVNGTNIGQENHGQVVARIKAGGEETRIFVADKECADWHTAQAVTLLSSLPYTLRLSSETPPEAAASSCSEDEESSPRVVHIAGDLDEGIEAEEEEEEGEEEEEIPKNQSPPPLPAIVPKVASSSSSSSEEDEDEEEDRALPPPPVAGTNYRRSGSVNSSDEDPVRPGGSYSPQHRNGNINSAHSKDELVAGLRLNLTAAEMRARVSSHKKKDPRQDKVDIKKKAEMIKNL